MRWAVVVPVKSTERGKSRIALEPVDRQALAAAMAFDTALAAARTPAVDQVLVMVDSRQDAALFDELAPSGVTARLCTVIGLNEAIRQGRDVLVEQRWTGPVASLPGDLPGVSAAELGHALELAGGRPRSVVADADGIGTTLLAAREAAHLDPQYGGASFARHLAAGSRPIEMPVDSGLRRDIDRLTDLIQALHAGGLGDRTATAVVRILERDGAVGDTWAAS